MSLSIWDYKPWWCQPWTILLTGMGIVGGSWGLFHRIWLTSLVSALIILWWFVFLIWMPYLFRKQVISQTAEIEQKTNLNR
ncbi:MAG: DUF6737 family protein [Microcystaceae cyanobacterium]